MKIPEGTHANIVVSKAWSELGRVRRMLGPPVAGVEKTDGSHMLLAQILDYTDPHGLWIELNSEKEKWPEQPPYRMLIPWQFVLTVVWAEEWQEKRSALGFALGATEDAADTTTG